MLDEKTVKRYMLQIGSLVLFAMYIQTPTISRSLLLVISRMLPSLCLGSGQTAEQGLWRLSRENYRASDDRFDEYGTVRR